MPTTRRDIYILTVDFNLRYAKGEGPRSRPCDFHFDKPPSRQDFLDAIMRFEPWTHVWQDTLIPIIQSEKCPWPMMDWMHKAASADIHDDDGLLIGQISVRRHSIYGVDSYDRHNIAVTFDAKEDVRRRVRKDKRMDASLAIMRETNTIQEKLSRMDEPSNADVRRLIREALVKHGILKPKARKKEMTKP